MDTGTVNHSSSQDGKATRGHTQGEGSTRVSAAAAANGVSTKDPKTSFSKEISRLSMQFEHVPGALGV